jgi:hypothetical protein
VEWNYILEKTSVSHDGGRDSLRKLEIYFMLIWLIPKVLLNKIVLQTIEMFKIVWNEIHIFGIHMPESCYRAELGVIVMDVEV